jgi:tetratricopeptide (TPR) repeat protein
MIHCRLEFHFEILKILEHSGLILDGNSGVMHRFLVGLSMLANKMDVMTWISKTCLEHPKDVPIKFLLGSLLCKHNKLKDSLKTFSELLESQNSILKSQVLCALGDVYAKTGNMYKSVDSYQKSLQIRMDPITILHLANVYATVGDGESELKMYEWLYKNPSMYTICEADSLYKLCVLSCKIGKFDYSKHFFQILLDGMKNVIHLGNLTSRTP